MLDVIFVSIKHRELPLFEEGLDLLRKDFTVLTFDNASDNYDNGVVKLSETLKHMEWDIVHFIDNDCFITDTDYIKQTLIDFENSELGFVSYFENGQGNYYNHYDFTGTIAEVRTMTFFKDYPFMFPSWENAMMMFKREAWDKVTDWSDMNKYIPELWKKDVRFGVKEVTPRLTYSHKGKGFFHVGNLMKYYYMLEKGVQIPIDKISKPRIGYLQKYCGLKGYPVYTKEWEDLIS